ncbi:MAG: hypothetical protein ACYC7I_02980 [Gammaproteobacteria bacterium]
MKYALKFANVFLWSTLFATAWATAYGAAVTAEADLRSTPFANTTYGPGVIEGKAHLVTDTRRTITKIVVHMEGLIPGSTHVGHIHTGTCAHLNPGLIVHNLEPLVANGAGVAISKTEVTDTMAGLKDCDWWVAVHESAQNTTPQSPAIAVGPVLINDREE